MISARRRRALEALVARGATAGEREAARVALAKADAADKAAAPPSGPRVHSAGFTITVEEMRAGFTVTFDDWFKHEERQREAWRQHEQKQRQAWETLFKQAPPKPPGPFGDGSPGPGPKKCTPKPPRGEAKFGAPRSCSYAFAATLISSSKSPTGELCYLVHGLLPSEATRFKVSGDPVILTESGAEFGARCTCWTQPEPGERALAYFERLTVTGRLEATLEDTCGMYMVPCSREQALAYQACAQLYLVTYKGKTWICRPGGPKRIGDVVGCTFHSVTTSPAP